MGRVYIPSDEEYGPMERNPSFAPRSHDGCPLHMVIELLEDRRIYLDNWLHYYRNLVYRV